MPHTAVLLRATAPNPMSSESLYILCRHDNLMNGFLCKECLREGIGGWGLCEHSNPWQSCNLCQHSEAWLLQRLCLWQRESEQQQENFLAFAMTSHPRLGNRVDPPEVNTETVTATTGKSVTVTTRVVVTHQHCAFSNIPDDILRKVWEEYQKRSTTEPFAVAPDGSLRTVW